MVAMPILTGLAFGAALFRSRRDPLIVLTTMLASAAIFLTTPYVGYLDNITVLFLLSLIVAFAGAAQTSWGARTAVFLIAMAAAFTHPTTGVLFGLTLMAVFGFHFLTSRFSLGAALKRDGPLLMSIGVRHDRRPRHVGDRDLGEGEALRRRRCPRRTRRPSSPTG